jgi:hypothetical protein
MRSLRFRARSGKAALHVPLPNLGNVLSLRQLRQGCALPNLRSKRLPRLLANPQPLPNSINQRDKRICHHHCKLFNFNKFRIRKDLTSTIDLPSSGADN